MCIRDRSQLYSKQIGGWDIKNALKPISNIITTITPHLYMGGRNTFSGQSYVQKTFQGLPPHYRARLSYSSFAGKPLLKFVKSYFYSVGRPIIRLFVDRTQVGNIAHTEYTRDFNFFWRSIIPHFGNNMTLRFAGFGGASQIGQWGIRNLRVELERCHSSCATCNNAKTCTCLLYTSPSPRDS
eukprot:TRINITY_DN12577_c0_g1_i2.p1 TRINITY_DN12577_c0_g1~~TRINITY_DN12577_c0_g1_i2.p1  ORF type:complete len:183 (+),score=37.38 TRINITY_DN12577_c0_g1_i2:64-612(+)